MYNVGGNSWAGYMNNRQSSPYINMLEGYARNYMDLNSPYNMKQFAGLRGEGRSAAGQQFNQGMKMSAAGQNPFANQQYQGAMSSNVDSAMNARNQQANTNQQLGQGMLGMGMQARATQAGMSQQQQQWDREYRQHQTGQALGLIGTLGSAGLMGFGIGGGLGKLGTAVAGNGNLGKTLDRFSDPTNNLATQPITITGETGGDMFRRSLSEHTMGQFGGNNTLLDALINGSAVGPLVTQSDISTIMPPKSLYTVDPTTFDDYATRYGGGFAANVQDMIDSGLPWKDYAEKMGWSRSSAKYNQLKNAAIKFGWEY